MLKNLFFAAMLLCCSDCKGAQSPEPHYSLVVTLDPGETMLVKSRDGEFKAYIDYTNINENIQLNCCHKNVHDAGFHIDYHVIIWMECPACHTYYNAADGGCRNIYCPARII